MIKFRLCALTWIYMFLKLDQSHKSITYSIHPCILNSQLESHCSMWQLFPLKIPHNKLLHQSESTAVDAITPLLLIGWQLTIRFQLFPPLPSTVQFRLAAHSTNKNGAPSQAALWLAQSGRPSGGEWEVRIPHPAVRALLMDGTDRIQCGGDKSESRSARRFMCNNGEGRCWWYLENIKGCLFDDCLCSATGCAAASPWSFKTLMRDMSWKPPVDATKSTGFYIWRRKNSGGKRGITNWSLIVVISRFWGACPSALWRRRES